MEQARARAADLETTVNVMQRRLRAAAYTPQGPDALVLFRNYDKHGAGGLSLQQFRAVVRKGAKTSEEDLDDHELVRLWKLLLATDSSTAAVAPGAPHLHFSPYHSFTKQSRELLVVAGCGEAPKGRRPTLSSDAFVSFVHGERELDLLQCCLAPIATPVRPNRNPPAAISSGSSESPRQRALTNKSTAAVVREAPTGTSLSGAHSTTRLSSRTAIATFLPRVIQKIWQRIGLR